MTKAPHAIISLLHRPGVGRRARPRPFPGSGASPAPRRLAPALIGALALIALSSAPAALAAPPITFAVEGHGPGRVERPAGAAVDQSSGDVYLADEQNQRISKFDSSGNFILAFGWGVKDGKAELQTCTTACEEGLNGSGAGQINAPQNIAVDNSGGSSDGDVYVFDRFFHRVEKFTPSGQFLLMFGKGVNTGTSGNPDVCTNAGPPTDVCGAGSLGTGPGQVSNPEAPLAVDAAGDLWIGDAERLERFSPAGAFLSEVAVPGAETIGALAIDTDPSSPSFEDFYAIYRNPIKQQLVGPVHKLSSAGAPIETLDASGNPNAIGIDPIDGELFLSDQFNPSETENFGKATLLAYDSSGAQTASFAHGQVIGHPGANALAFGHSAGRLYAVSSASGPPSAAQSFALPPSGPYLSEGSLIAKPIKGTGATLNATLNPEGAATEYHFEYLTEAAYQQNLANSLPGFSGAAATLTATLPADFAEHPVSVPVTGLSSDTAYRFRLLASNECEPVKHPGTLCKGNAPEQEATFTTLPPAQIDDETVIDVTASSATLTAQINPLGTPSEYHFQYITEAAYLENLAAELDPFTGAASTPDAAIGAAEQDQGVSQHVQGLTPASAYLYRAVAHNTGGEARGPVRSFATQALGAFALPDGRQWEQVSPPEKHGASLLPHPNLLQASANGDALAYLASAPTEAEPQGNSNFPTVLSTRLPGGWASRVIALPNETATGFSTSAEEYSVFSEDLSLALAQPIGLKFDPLLSPQASEITPYLRTDFAGADLSQPCTTSCYRPLVSGCPPEGEPCSPSVLEHANVPPGTVFGGCPVGSPSCGPTFQGATPDLSHIVLSSEVALTPGTSGGLYEWAAGQLTPVAGGAAEFKAISPDGSRVVFSGAGNHLYLRDLTREETVQLDALQGGSTKLAPTPAFQALSADGSKVSFTDLQRLTPDSGGEAGGAPDLYSCEILEDAEGHLNCHLSDLTPRHGSEAAAVQGSLGASVDGSYLYFVANGVLAEGAVPGTCDEHSPGPADTCNLYLFHNGATKLIAVLSGEDAPDWKAQLLKHTARVSPDGRWLAFMSQRPLTGYDNRDAVSGERDEEVFLYHAGEGEEGSLVCASCNPTGARPHGVKFATILNGLASGGSIWESDSWIAANVPGWNFFGLRTPADYQSRYLSNSGRLFFNSSDSLVPQDSNGNQDVYQYEPPAVGDCTASRPTFGRASGGCVSLISSGTSAGESAFVDASETGDDVFFLTTASLSPQDPDTAVDIYDAHRCTASVPCLPPLPPPSPACEGDACQSPAVPPNDPTPGSLTFNGAGNVHQAKPKKPKQHRKHKKRRAHKKTHHGQVKSNRGGQK